ncbi:hypothetical protein [Streptomyces sp. NPDC000878]
MNDLMIDYRTLIRIESAELPQALRNAPPKAKGQWIFALLDIARTDHHPVNQEPGINLTLRLLFASRLLEFVDQELGTPERSTAIALECMKVARKAIEDNAREVPPLLRADAVVVRVLRCFRLTRTQALEVAREQRGRYLDALTAGLDRREFDHVVRVDGDSELNTINILLPKVRSFQENISDGNVADELNEWLDIHSELLLGDTVTGLLAARQERRPGRA